MVETKQPRRDFGRIYRKAGSRFLWVRYRIRGKEYVESAHSEKPREAEKLLARRQAELGVGIFVAPDVKRTTFEDLCRFIRDEYAVKGRRSTRTLEVVLRRLAVTFAGARAIALTPDRFAAYVRLRMEAGVEQATIRNELNALRHALRLAKIGRASCRARVQLPGRAV